MTEFVTRSFLIGPKLGEGAWGEVYRARQSSSGGLRQTVAIKLLKPGRSSDDDVARLRAEALILGDVDHQAILKVFSLSRLDGRLALVAEHVDGADLKDCIYSSSPPSVRAVLEIVDLVAEGLQAAWDQHGCVHRDIKPSNLRITRSGLPKILDFGIAKRQERTDGVSVQTATGVYAGTVSYMSPDRFSHPPPALPAADVWALGAILFECFARRPLYKGLDGPPIFGLSFNPEHYERYVEQALNDLPPDLDEVVVAIIGDCLAFDPAERPAAGRLAEWCRVAADHVGGKSLREWATSRDWPDPVEMHGALVGLELTDTTLSGHSPPGEGGPVLPSSIPTYIPDPSSGPTRRISLDTPDRLSDRRGRSSALGRSGVGPRRRLGLYGAVAVLVCALAVVVPGSIGVLGYALSSGGGGDPTTAEPGFDSVLPEVVPRVVEIQGTVEVDSLNEPVAVHSAPVPPAQARPQAAPRKAAPREAVATGILWLETEVKVELSGLVGSPQVLDSAAHPFVELPVGAYQVRALFPRQSGWVQAADLHISADQPRLLRCSSLLSRCSVEDR